MRFDCPPQNRMFETLHYRTRIYHYFGHSRMPIRPQEMLYTSRSDVVIASNSTPRLLVMIVVVEAEVTPAMAVLVAVVMVVVESDDRSFQECQILKYRGLTRPTWYIPGCPVCALRFTYKPFTPSRPSSSVLTDRSSLL